MSEHLTNEVLGLHVGRVGKTSFDKSGLDDQFMAPAIRRSCAIIVSIISLPATAKNMLEAKSMTLTLTEVPSASRTMCQRITSPRSSGIWVFLPRPSLASLQECQYVGINRPPRPATASVRTKALRNYHL